MYTKKIYKKWSHLVDSPIEPVRHKEFEGDNSSFLLSSIIIGLFRVSTSVIF